MTTNGFDEEDMDMLGALTGALTAARPLQEEIPLDFSNLKYNCYSFKSISGNFFESQRAHLNYYVHYFRCFGMV
jgi:hypothetical protein